MSADLLGVVRVVGERQLGQELVPDELWKIVEPLIPPQRKRPQGGGTNHVDDRAVFIAIVYVLTSGWAWRHLPAEFGVSKATAHRRFVAWTKAGLWRRLHRAVLNRLGEQAAIDWSRAVVDAASVRAKRHLRAPIGLPERPAAAEGSDRSWTPWRSRSGTCGAGARSGG